jgi:hypothetical protein
MEKVGHAHRRDNQTTTLCGETASRSCGSVSIDILELTTTTQDIARPSIVVFLGLRALHLSPSLACCITREGDTSSREKLSRPPAAMPRGIESICNAAACPVSRER